jgi:effector-binding domain-containing protein
MPYENEIAHAEPVHTVVIRSQVRPQDLSQFVPAACGEVWSFVCSAGLPRPGRHLALYLDAQGSLEVGVEITEPFVRSNRVVCSQLPAGSVARTVHFGPYGRLSQAHAAVRQWCAEQRRRCTGVCWELYGRWQESWNSDPSKIRTDIFYLLDDGKG